MIGRMLRFAFFFFLLLTACTDNRSLIAIDQEAAVIGGRDVTDDDPLMRSVVGLVDNKTNMLCAATLLSDRHAITAAHCLVQEINDLRLVFGKDLRKRGLTERAVSSIRVCPTFDATKNDEPNCDVGLVVFDGGLPEGYRPAELMWDASPLTPQRLLTVIGYGMNNTDDWQGEGTLRRVEVPLTNATFSPNEFLLDQRKKRGACHGDSGAGIFLEEDGQSPVLIGVVNRGHQDLRSKCNVYGVALSVPVLYRWILSNLNEL